MFIFLKGADFDTAKQALIVNNFNLEQAINYHLERSNAIGAPEDDVAAASTSTDANLPIDDEDEVRPPIAPKREQLILPNEDNFRYRKRRTVASRTTVCPLRNFELEGRMQEERLKAAVMGNFTGADGTDDDDSMNYLSLPTTAPNPKAAMLGFSNSTRELFQNRVTSSVQSSTKASAVPSRLSELFRPPVDITFCGSFQAARDYAKEQNKWLIVNVQDMSDFNCQVLNRDIWSSDKLRAVIKKYFIFWQVAIDNTDGHRFQVFYSIQVFPYVGIIDPRTGEEKLSYKTGFKVTLNDFMDILKSYLKENTSHPNVDDGDVSEVDDKFFDPIKPSNSTNNHATASPCAKRKRLEPSSLTEQEQIEIAIAHSLREVSAAEDDNKSESFGEPSDESDFDFDDESSNQSYVKSQTSQTVSEKSNTFDNKITEPDCDSKVDEPIASTTKAETVETYDNYLGDESDAKARIQLRLPSGDRDVLEWPCTTKLKALKLYIPFKYPELTSDPYKVICPFVGGQSNNILDMDDTLTLKEANLYPTVILHLRNED
ncbi:UBX domain-containing protein 7 isoform X2 [Sitodiplosis mosellana]|uniref:UBX domain-containing protein 7 isoform X2 n=1 Tax=Sitodiplosis mosellana TaxID=263140 RepID=UPI0024443DFF|nr:UBX domain-containing protein 7 isoform X2 [Sitodiplosis mosellana]